MMHAPNAITDTNDTHFDRTIAVHPRHGGGTEGQQFDVDLDESWASLRGVLGGYMTAVAVRAAEHSSPGRPVRTVATSFLRPAEIGPAVLRVEALRAGRSFTTLAVGLTQQGRSITESRITMLAPVAGRDWTDTTPDRPPPREHCVHFTPPPSIRHFGQAELLIDPATIPVADGSPAHIAGHVRALDSRPIDAAWLAMVGDWFPPSSFRRLQPPIGGVSIDYTVHIHAVPSADIGWLEGVFVAPTSVDGITVEHGTLAVPGGVRVAEIFHTRWTG